MRPKNRNIDLHFEINDLSEMSIPSVDLTVVMSNLLGQRHRSLRKIGKAGASHGRESNL